MKRLLWMFPLLFAFMLTPAMSFAQQAAPATSGKAAGSGTVKETAKKAGTAHHKNMKAEDHHKMMMEKCKEMQAKREKVMADMKAMDERLDAKITAMNAAKGDEKIAAMAAVLDEMVAQRKEMREKMGELHHGMMCGKCPMMGEGHGDMMGMHGDMKGMHGGMHGKPGAGMDCPMMKGGDTGGGEATGGAQGTGEAHGGAHKM